MAIQNYLTDQINAVFDDCNKIKLYDNGNTKLIERGSKEFDQLLQLWQIAINDGYEMPALGVSIHDLTIKEMQKGLHLEFLFDETKYHNEMPFDSLLVDIIENQGGYQLIRQYDNKYDGRCFYVNAIDLNNDLYNFVNSLK